MLEICLLIGAVCRTIAPHTTADIVDKSYPVPIVYCIENPTDSLKTVARRREDGNIIYILEDGLRFCDEDDKT